MEAIFKPEHVGQVVSEPRFGDGVINHYNQGDLYPVAVYFESRNDTLYFKANGAYAPAVLPTLQFGPLDNWQRRTVPQLKDGDLVEVKHHGDGWILHSIKMTELGANYVKTRNDDGDVTYSIPIEGKEWRFFKP